MRATLIARDDVKAAAVDFEEGLAYVIPRGKFDAEAAIAEIEKSDDKFKVKLQ